MARGKKIAAEFAQEVFAEGIVKAFTGRGKILMETIVTDIQNRVGTVGKEAHKSLRSKLLQLDEPRRRVIDQMLIQAEHGRIDPKHGDVSKLRENGLAVELDKLSLDELSRLADLGEDERWVVIDAGWPNTVGQELAHVRRVTIETANTVAEMIGSLFTDLDEPAGKLADRLKVAREARTTKNGRLRLRGKKEGGR
ncbi:MAG: hypothetical protein A3G58_01505 [Candidatus Colwellbacteria bacterium RIFCSPLOWO2_12_FULL_46_17]|uniref:Uncharacterized protein n=1 Tax=Candidatus Colwellbacteria bacterium RIFCSPLOWO2_12_FULL_46_17 TaxID=1797695 RepID=A0A1G1ZD33_9BACT|nr:MAG: hypothetical protein A3G58_01505 [Candidatus Colwellbacteria bacterium RIFCSPLOWO2_12_FULL_46_17]